MKRQPHAIGYPDSVRLFRRPPGLSVRLLCVLVLVLVLTGCEQGAAPAAPATPQSTTSSTTNRATPQASATGAPATTGGSTAGAPAPVMAIAPIDPIAADDALPPVALSIPEANLTAEVTPMQWIVALVNDVRTTIWVLPVEGVGWHSTSAGVGAAGNVVISGHQLLGTAPFAPIALGDVAVGQQVQLTDSNGVVFAYEVIEVTEPLPISSNLTNEREIAQQVTRQGSEPLLTLVSGWPDFSTTHRVVVVAKLVGRVQ